jgi:hypothetical protein
LVLVKGGGANLDFDSGYAKSASQSPLSSWTVAGGDQLQGTPSGDDGVVVPNPADSFICSATVPLSTLYPNKRELLGADYPKNLADLVAKNGDARACVRFNTDLPDKFEAVATTLCVPAAQVSLNGARPSTEAIGGAEYFCTVPDPTAPTPFIRRFALKESGLSGLATGQVVNEKYALKLKQAVNAFVYAGTNAPADEGPLQGNGLATIYLGKGPDGMGYAGTPRLLTSLSEWQSRTEPGLCFQVRDETKVCTDDKDLINSLFKWRAERLKRLGEALGQEEKLLEIRGENPSTPGLDRALVRNQNVLKNLESRPPARMGAK